MDKIKIVEIEGLDYVVIDHGNEQFTSMLKSTYEAQQVKHLTENPTEDVE